jgi:hypothetical protein
MAWCDIDLARSDIAGHSAASARRAVTPPGLLQSSNKKWGNSPQCSPHTSVLGK